MCMDDVVLMAVDPGPERKRRGERGANVVEYALLIALIVIVCVAGLAQLGREVPQEGFVSITTSI